MSEQIYSVSGMTCEHCVAAVSGEVAGVPGVESVEVDLARGVVTVRGEGWSDDDIKAAVDEAGYAVVEA